MPLKQLFITAVTLMVITVFAADGPAAAPAAEAAPAAGEKQAPAPGRKKKGPRMQEARHGRNRWRKESSIWYAFSRMSEAERREMMKIQRTDPEKFRAEMTERAEKLAAEYRKRQQELRNMAQQIRNCKDEDLRSKLRTELAAELKKDFLRRIENSRRQVEEMKRRAARLEKELDRRVANADKAAETMADAMISGRGQRRNRQRMHRHDGPKAPSPAPVK